MSRKMSKIPANFPSTRVGVWRFLLLLLRVAGSHTYCNKCISIYLFSSSSTTNFSILMFFKMETTVEGCGKPSASCDDSLVIISGEVESRRGWKATNESRRLIGGLF